MIDTSTLDEILPVPDIDDLQTDVTAELTSAGFAVTNFNSGGIFYTLLMILFKIRIELVKLLRSVLNNMYVTHASGAWLVLKAADFSKKRKAAVKTQGLVTISRAASGDAITISKGHIFKTDKDINGDVLRFVVTAETVLQQGALSTTVPVEAEKEGAAYNVATGKITKSLTYINGIDTITNAEGWITLEGSDIEDYESLRERVLNSWADLATMPIAQKYKNACEAVAGVLFVRVDDQHPRGQGTIDIIVTSPTGEASEALLTLVEAAADEIKGPYDNLLVKSSTTQATDVSITVSVAVGTNTDTLADRVSTTVESVMSISSDRNLNELLHSDLIYAIRRDISCVTNVKVTVPADDLVLDTDVVIIPGTITITVQEV